MRTSLNLFHKLVEKLAEAGGAPLGCQLKLCEGDIRIRRAIIIIDGSKEREGSFTKKKKVGNVSHITTLLSPCNPLIERNILRILILYFVKRYLPMIHLSPSTTSIKFIKVKRLICRYYSE